MTDPVLAGYRRLIRPALFRYGAPEATHDVALSALGRIGAKPAARAALRALHPAGTPVELAGIAFPNRVGVAAGLDKRGDALRAWAALGFGHVELGTITPRPQRGNPWPRVVRLPRSGAICNAMGFPSDGAAALAARLRGLRVTRGGSELGLRVGISLGKNKDTPLADAAADYLESFALLAPFADYVAVNVSSPNTPGLRRLQDAAALRDILRTLIAAARSTDPGNPVPVMVKIAPDLGRDALDELLAVATETGVAAIIATNTTVARTGLVPAEERLAVHLPGGISGAPLTRRALDVVRHVADSSNLPVIGAGGIMTPADAAAMLAAGARLVQVYTGWIYSGPALVRGINALP